MKKKEYLLLCAIFIISCASNNKIATVKNNTSGIIACLIRKDESMTDSVLYFNRSYIDYQIQPQNYDTYMLDNRNLTKAADSEIRYIYILKLDSLNKFRKLKVIDGILEHSLLKKIVVQLNKVEEPLDTIFAKP